MQLNKETGLLVNFIQDMESKFKAQVGALKTAREASDEAYKTLVQHENAHALIEGKAAYSAFIDYANTEIEHFKKEVVK